MQRDLFPYLLPRPLSDDELAQVASGILFDWFRTLCYTHTQAVHTEILESLRWQSVRAFFHFCSINSTSAIGDFHAFAAEIRRQAGKARDVGLVRPSRRCVGRAAVRCGRTSEMWGGAA